MKKRSRSDNINVLILSAGRRVELISCFKRAKERLGIKGNIIAADASELAPALYFADINEVVPRISDSDGYIRAIVDICRNFKVSLVVPTIDTELILLSERRAEIEETGAKVLISEEKVTKICRDKTNTQIFLEEHGFLVPHMLSKEELSNPGSLQYPLFIKPKDGSSSINAFQVHNEEELEVYLKLIDNPMVQEYIEGTEFTIDAFLDFASRLITVVPRVRIATRSGEIAKGVIKKDRAIMDEVSRLMAALKPIGHITVQCKKTKKGIEFIEINPRFGGGAPMSIMAGADSCENLYRLLLGEELSYNERFRENLTFLRFDQSIMLNEEMKREYEYEGSYF